MDRTERSSLYLELALLCASLAGLAVLGWNQDPQRYLVFHTLAELFGITVAAGAFMVVWNARRFSENGYLLFLGITGLFVAGLDLLHLLSYKGMSLLPFRTADVPTQLWVAARYMQAGALVLAPAFVARRLPAWAAATASIVVASLLALSVTVFHWFPSAFVEGKGLTAFKDESELVVIALMLVGLALLLRKRETFAPSVLALVAGSILVFAFAEVAFTMYASVYGRANLVGHLLRVVGMYGIYRAIIATSLSRPYDVLFRDLKTSGDRLRSAKDLSDALNGIESALRSTLDADTMLETVGPRAIEAIGVDGVSIALREGGRWVERYVHGIPGLEPGVELSDRESPIRTAAANVRTAAVVDDASSDPRVNAETMRRYRIASLLAVPLLLKDEVFAILSFAKLDVPVPFTPEQVDFASRLAASLSLALENARLYALERRIADTLQEALISPPPDLKGLEFSHLYRSATETASVGGDFYEVFEIRPDAAGIIVGDVSGKGVEAAALTAVVKTAIKANVHSGGAPDEVMTRVNAFLHRYTTDSTFVTAFYGALDLGTGALSYCNAGHPPAALKRADGSAVELEAGSPLLGAFDDVRYSRCEQHLDPGDVLLLYTDGVVESRGAGGQFGEGRLLEAVAAWTGGAAGLPAHVVDAVERHTAGILADDIAVVAIARV